MLILTRKKDESIVIDDQIEIKIIGIDENKVKLGISAPKDIEIHRKEIYLEIQEENKKAAVSNLNLKGLEDLFKK
ncbi:carbon storage regulator CsrA [Crassaminicella profunda]|uniref:carbon storage regulator CsrA n=1 Tax=Crassaminicella profunda TaxID=1286698 RepID=UPI001CA6C532|nr:carbon storage regulator CsrA [Crassaminicella profunda]QZY54317.1 carbon storage regulator CsrA [Crassaminicella profunda]